MGERGMDAVLVAAIDFGTTYSGYAFQFKHDFDNDPTKISAPQCWNGGKSNLLSLKTPTVLLLNDKKEIVSFGYEAEDKYANLCMEDKHKQYYYFRRFKMKLSDEEGLNKTSTIDDETGKALPAIDVFSLSIQCLKSHLLQILSDKGTDVKEKDIYWVLTVPAIWNDSAKQFMRDAAFKAGIPSNQLSIALEPEAASMYCQYLPVEKYSNKDGATQFAAAPPGTRYMVVDLGGGTADITVHEKLQGGALKEVCKASGGPWGGTAVDSAFFQLLLRIVQGAVMQKFMKTEVYDYLDLTREFESAKRSVSMGTASKIRLKLPVSLNEICTSELNSNMKTCIAKSPHSSEISITGDKIAFAPEFIRDMFRKVTDNIISHIKSQLATPGGKQVSIILMVGGFSESAFVQDVMKAEFHDKNGMKVIIPKEAGLAVMNGAVIFGRRPDTIQSRVLRYTYGVDTTVDFDPKEHPESKKFLADGIPKCDDIFAPFINMDTEVSMGHQETAIYSTLYKFQRTLSLPVYTTQDKNTKYVTDIGCKFLGRLDVHIPNPTEEERTVEAVFTFGNTELQVKAMEQGCEIPFQSSFVMNELKFN